MWQDYVMSFSSILFSYSLIPQVFKCIKEKKVQITNQTIGLTWLGVLLYNLCSFTLELYMSVALGTITFLCWTLLWILKYKYKEI